MYRKDTEHLYHAFVYSLILLLSSIYPFTQCLSLLVQLYVIRTYNENVMNNDPFIRDFVTLNKAIINYLPRCSYHLLYMASNGLVANPKKTVFMILGLTKEEKKLPLKVKVGDSYIEKSENTKLLGVTINEKLNWEDHYIGKKGLISCLNRSLSAIRRVVNQIPKKSLPKIEDSLWTSKLRYGSQISAQVRCNNSDPQNTILKSVQVAQNKLLRLIDNSTTSL